MILANPVDLIIVNKKNELLLVKRNEKEDNEIGKWSIAGGGSKIGESFEDALKREINEELNCKIIKYDYFKSYFYKIKNINVRAVYFYGNIRGKIKISKEHSEFKWFKFSEIKKLNIAFNQKKVLLDFIKFYKEKN